MTQPTPSEIKKMTPTSHLIRHHAYIIQSLVHNQIRMVREMDDGAFVTPKKDRKAIIDSLELISDAADKDIIPLASHFDDVMEKVLFTSQTK